MKSILANDLYRVLKNSVSNHVLSAVDLAHAVDAPLRLVVSALHNDLRFSRLVPGPGGWMWTIEALRYVAGSDRAALPKPPAPPKPPPAPREPRVRQPHRAVLWLRDHPGEHTADSVAAALGMTRTAVLMALRRKPQVVLGWKVVPHSFPLHRNRTYAYKATTTAVA